MYEVMHGSADSQWLWLAVQIGWHLVQTWHVGLFMFKSDGQALGQHWPNVLVFCDEIICQSNDCLTWWGHPFVLLKRQNQKLNFEGCDKWFWTLCDNFQYFFGDLSSPAFLNGYWVHWKRGGFVWWAWWSSWAADHCILPKPLKRFLMAGYPFQYVLIERTKFHLKCLQKWLFTACNWKCFLREFSRYVWCVIHVSLEPNKRRKQGLCRASTTT